MVNGKVMDSSGKVLRKTEGTIKQQSVEAGQPNSGKPAGMNALAQPVFIAVQEVDVVVEPKDDDPPQVALHGELVVDEGGVEIISPEILTFNDTDTQSDRLTVSIIDPPQFGYLEIRDDRAGIAAFLEL